MRNGHANNGGAILYRVGPDHLVGLTGARGRSVILTPADNLISRLDSVKQTRPDRWQAKCPSHDDRSPSLAITENSDGTLLIKCWSGCSADSIVKAVGLELRDLFPRNFNYQSTSKGKQPRTSPSEVVRVLLHEATVLVLALRQLQRGEELTLKDQGRIELAAQTISSIRGAL